MSTSSAQEKYERRHMGECVRCGRRAFKAANWEGLICRTCCEKASRTYGICPGCGTDRLLAGPPRRKAGLPGLLRHHSGPGAATPQTITLSEQKQRQEHELRSLDQRSIPVPKASHLGFRETLVGEEFIALGRDDAAVDLVLLERDLERWQPGQGLAEVIVVFAVTGLAAEYERLRSEGATITSRSGGSRGVSCWCSSPTPAA